MKMKNFNFDELAIFRVWEEIIINEIQNFLKTQPLFFNKFTDVLGFLFFIDTLSWLKIKNNWMNVIAKFPK